MAEKENGVSQQAQGQMATHCTGDCRRCFPMQRAYCASQIAYNNMKLLESLMLSLNSLSQGMHKLNEKVEAFNNSEVMLFNPSEHNVVPEQKEEKPLFVEESTENEE